MGYTTTLWILIGLITGVSLLFYIFVWPRFGEIIANQKALANNDKIIRDELEIARKAALEARDHAADIKARVALLERKDVGAVSG